MDYLLTGTVRWEKAAGGEPRPGEPRADPGLDRLDQVAAAIRRDAHRRVPGAGRRGGAGGAGARRGARDGAAGGPGGAADDERGGVRRLPQGRGGPSAGTGDLSQSLSAIRYFEQAVALDRVRHGVDGAVAGTLAALLQRHAQPGERPARARRGGAGAQAGAEPAGRPSRAGGLLLEHPPRPESRTRGLRGGSPAGPQQRGPARGQRGGRDATGKGRTRWPTSPGRRRWTHARSPSPAGWPTRCSGCAAIRRHSPHATAAWCWRPRTWGSSRPRPWSCSDRVISKARAEWSGRAPPTSTRPPWWPSSATSTR